jgi:hypothetical protein
MVVERMLAWTVEVAGVAGPGEDAGRGRAGCTSVLGADVRPLVRLSPTPDAESLLAC